PAGTYELYLYGHGAIDEQNTAFTVEADGMGYGTQATTLTSDYLSTEWTEGWQYVRFSDMVVSDGGSIIITLGQDGSGVVSANGLQLIGHVAGARLAYQEAESNGLANINLANGTARFWFKPDWTSASSGGSGPLAEASLLRVGDSQDWWAIYASTNGNQLKFGASTNGVSTNFVTADLTNWVADTWHQVAVTYTPSNSALYLDGQIVATGTGVERFPNA